MSASEPRRPRRVPTLQPVLRSLRARLFAFLLALAAISALAVGTATYLSVRAEADQLFDYHLEQMALSLRDHGRIDETERAVLENREFDYVVQIWSVDGVELYSSRAPDLPRILPPRAVLGFSEVDVAGAPWRVYSAATPTRVLQVGQPLAVRRRLAAAAAGRSVLPIVGAAPLVALGLWWLVGVSLAPLARVAEATRTRGAGSLEPLPVGGLPTEVEPLVASFNALLARLAAALEAQRAFVADAAHELRTPLTALKLQVGLLRDADDRPTREAALERLRAGVDRAARLVEQLLALARAEPGSAVPHAPLDLAELVRQALGDLGAVIAQRGAEARLEAPASLPYSGDAQALRSLVRNLIDNATKYGGAAPRVKLSLSFDEGAPVLRVDDAGPGIPVAERERVFDRFHRRESSAGDGSGLGLAIVRAVAEQHGATVRLADSPLGGLRVELRFPPVRPRDASSSAG